MNRIKNPGRVVVAALTALGLGLILLTLVSGHGPQGTTGQSTGVQGPPAASSKPSTHPTSPSPQQPQTPEVEATPQTDPSSALPESLPERVEIPAIGVRSSLIQLGLAADGTAEVPSFEDADQAGWYRYSPTPGEIGPAVLIGHVDSPEGPAVFYQLSQLSSGDIIRVDREDGSVAEFTVDTVTSFGKDSFPTEQVYGDIDHPGLRLITCGGDYDAGSGGYQANTVVFASAVQS